MEIDDFQTVLRKLRNVHDVEIASLRNKISTLSAKLNSKGVLNESVHRACPVPMSNSHDVGSKNCDTIISMDDPDLEIKFTKVADEAHGPTLDQDRFSPVPSVICTTSSAANVVPNHSLILSDLGSATEQWESSRTQASASRAARNRAPTFPMDDSASDYVKASTGSPGSPGSPRKRSSEFTFHSARTSCLNGSIELREQWCEHGLQHEESVQIIREFSRSVSRASLDPTSSDHVQAKAMKRFIAQPGANWRLSWDLIGAVLIAYDTIAIPFTLSFEPKDGILLHIMDWTTMLFWTADIFLTFFVGYVRNGITVMSPARIARRYLETWFLLDVIVVIADWFNNVGNASSGSSVSELGVMLRSLRAIRILRLLRLLKLRRLLADLQDHISSEYTYLLLNLSKLLLFILALNHAIACAWYFVGREGLKRGSPCWIEASRIMNRSLGYKYTTSIHWTLTQFTPASMEVVPMNTGERIFTVVVLMFALVAFSSFVGSISTSMTALRNMNADTNKEFWMLRRYLKQNSVSRPVTRRILRYLEYVVDRKTGKVEVDDINILALLTSHLHQELTFELTRPQIQSFAVFKFLLSEPGLDVLLRKLCAASLSTELSAAGDALFYVGDQAENFYCLLHGKVDYCIDGIDLYPPVECGEWISEASLFVPWKHMGRLQASAETELMIWKVDKFIETCCSSVASWTPLSIFAERWIECFRRVNFTDVVRDVDFRSELNQLVGVTGTDARRSRKSWRSTTSVVTNSLGNSLSLVLGASWPSCSQGSGSPNEVQ